MAIKKEVVAGKLRRWEKYLNNYRLPCWEDIPDFGLYMEQVLTLLTKYLDYMPPELKEEQFITAATINNYVRKKIIPDPYRLSNHDLFAEAESQYDHAEDSDPLRHSGRGVSEDLYRLRCPS